jgi:GntR family transcriptional regulator, transcriptional repressor for pyruvate dehydrogenase complex
MSTLNGFSRINTANRVYQAVESIKEYILREDLKPGAELPPEDDMAKQIGVSKFSMREALRIAQAQGLLEINRGSRTKVAQPTAEPAIEAMSNLMRNSEHALLDLTEARAGLECHIARLAAQRAQPEQMEAMQEALVQMEKNRKNLSLCAEYDTEFHHLLAQATGNVIFEIMLAPVAKLLEKSRKATLKTATPEKSLEGHKKILEAIRNRDSELAAHCMADHLRTAEKGLKENEDTES